MAHTYSALFVHLIWSTKRREPFITNTLKNRLHQYIHGIVKHDGACLLAINGVEDHVHLLIKIETNHKLSALVCRIKSKSSRFAKIISQKHFSWQEGYAAFPVSQTIFEPVKNYINNQEAHHKKISFTEEYLAFLKKHGITYDENNLFE